LKARTVNGRIIARVMLCATTCTSVVYNSSEAQSPVQHGRAVFGEIKPKSIEQKVDGTVSGEKPEGVSTSAFHVVLNEAGRALEERIVDVSHRLALPRPHTG
jgi:hypothetical protein